VAVAAADAVSQTHLALLPISSQRPAATQIAVEIPQLERKRLGLHVDRPAWVYAGEHNHDIAERSFYLTPRLGERQALSPGFLRTVLRAFRPVLALGAGRVNRR
jgi:hypothetical protein